MPHIKLSKKTIDAIEPPLQTPTGASTQTFYRDTDLTGFGLKVTSAGTKTYIVESRINGRSKRLTLGKHGALTPEQARKQARIMLGDIALGKDPQAEKRESRVRGITLEQAYRDYLQSRRNLTPSTLRDYKQCIEGSLKDWLAIPIAEIGKDLVEKRHRKLGATSPARANNTMRVLRAVFNFSMEQYEDQNGQPILAVNPVTRLSKNRSWYEVRRRQTLLTPTQLRPWYDATLKLNQETTRDYLHFLLFTGLRRSEASRMTWADVNFDERTFVIPVTKNHDPHYLPMSDFLESLLRRRLQQTDTQWVFPSPLTEGPLKEPRTALKRVAEHSGITVTLHDLRRTFITIAESLDIPAYALKRLLNHRTTHDVTAGYIVPSTERLRDPMQRVTNYLKEQMAIIKESSDYAE